MENLVFEKKPSDGKPGFLKKHQIGNLFFGYTYFATNSPFLIPLPLQLNVIYP